MKNTTRNWNIQFYGVRGSFPLADRSYLAYGGNTVCTYVDCGCHVILDAGTGLRELGRKLALQDKQPIHLLLSHLHADHILGLFDFQPFFDKGREIHIYGEGDSLEKQLGSFLGSPFWPVGIEDFPAHVSFHPLAVGKKFCINDRIRVQTMRSCHPGHCIAFRLDDNERSLGYALDYALAADTEKRLEQFFKNCDIAIVDGSYAPGQEVPGWGHSSWKQAMELGNSANIGKIVISHYSAGLDDEKLLQQQNLANTQFERCIFAKEGMSILL